MKLIAVVGSRELPASWSGRVSQVVSQLVRRSCRICSGGALGADLFALQATVQLGREACEGSRVYLPGSLLQASSPCRAALLQFEPFGGRIISGEAAGEASEREAYIRALFSRTVDLVRASSGIVAFVAGESKGTWFTCEQAVRTGKQVVLFSAEGPRAIHSLGCGRWVPVQCWEGAWRWETSVPAGQHCRHGIMVECCAGV